MNPAAKRFVRSILAAGVASCLFGGVTAVASSDPRDPSFAGISAPDFRLMTQDECRSDYQPPPRTSSSRRASIFDSGIDSSFASLSGIGSGASGEVLPDSGLAFDSEPVIDTSEDGLRIPSSALREWAPNGSWDQLPSPECRPQWLEKQMLATGHSPSEQANVVRAYFAKCEASLRAKSPTPVFALTSLSKARYPLCEHRGMRKAVIRLPNGAIVRGFLGLKPGSAPRPLVLLKCGVFCNAGDLSHRFMLMHLFDSSPFHVLAVGNLTGADYVRDNGHLAIGGLDEGQQLLRLSKRLRDGPLASRISTVHFAGVSLGAHGGLFASYMNPFNSDPNRAPLLSSALTICPVVDLEDSVTDLFQTPLKKHVAKWVFVREVYKIVTSVPILKELFPENDPDPTRIPSLVASKAAEYYSRLGRGWNLPPFDRVALRSSEDVWDNNRFVNYLDRPITTPTLAIASINDPIVPTRSNSGVLVRALKGRRPDALNAVIVPGGSHCAINMTYGWPVATSLYRSFVLSHDREFQASMREKTARIPANHLSFWARLWSEEKYHLAQFGFEAGRPEMTIRYRIFSPYQNSGGCYARKTHEAPDACFRWATTKVALASITDERGRLPSWALVPRNPTEAEVLTRWANANMVLIAESGQAIEDSSERPAGLRWRTYGRDLRANARVAT